MNTLGLQIDVQLLTEFERGLDIAFPEKSAIPAKVLGYGEISTVFEIVGGGELAYKRLSMFETAAEVEQYQAMYAEYVQVLQKRIGIRVVPSDTVMVRDARDRAILYIVQTRLASESICHTAIKRLSPGGVERLVLAVLQEMKKAFDFNSGELALGLDGQLSNWAIAGFDPAAPELGQEIELAYLDTSSPLISKHGVEQLDPELFLRSVPLFLAWVIRMFFLDEVMTRYYDVRRVTLDLIANLYKEQCSEVIPALVDLANDFFSAEIRQGGFEPMRLKEVRDYYRQDALIWRVYLASRRIDRSLHRLLRREYPYILPKIEAR